jgi:hypothetical protein
MDTGVCSFLRAFKKLSCKFWAFDILFLLIIVQAAIWAKPVD